MHFLAISVGAIASLTFISVRETIAFAPNFGIKSKICASCSLSTSMYASNFKPTKYKRTKCTLSVSTDTENDATSQTPTPQAGEDSDLGGCTVGDTKGATLFLEDIAISRGANPLLDDVSLRVERNERWGIVGPNGAGKSTLLGSIMGTVRIDNGKALVAPKIRVGYLKQTAVAGSTNTVAEEAASAMKEINEAQLAMKEAEEIIAGGDYNDQVLKRLEVATEAFDNAGGWTKDQVVDSILAGLGFTPEDSDRPCSDFSGGWQMRIALAKLLLSKPSLLLLDEPSNHLDSSARNWLANYLANYDDGSIIIVSHDLNLLEKSVNSIAEVAGGTLLKYVGCTYSEYLTEKEFRRKTAMAEYERNVAEAARLQAWVDKFGTKATKASQAQSRVKMIEKMKQEGKLTPPSVAVTEVGRKPVLLLPDPPKAIGEDYITLERAEIGYDPQVPLIKNVHFNVQRGMKILLRGPNGAGKSTLVAALRGVLPLLEGTRTENVKLRLGMFTQDLAQELDPNSRAIDLALDYARNGEHGDIFVSDNDARNVMGALGLGADKPLRLIRDLSGGEKARVALSMFALKASNLLLLDEPSNHLDVGCIDALAESLSGWGDKDGAIVVISHDRSFCERVGFTHVGTVIDEKFTLEERGLRDSDWTVYDMKNNAVEGEGDMGVANPAELTAEEKAEQAKRRKLVLNAPKRIAKLEGMIETCEEVIAGLDEEMLEHGSDVGKLMDLTEKKQEEEERVATMMEEWEELETILAENEDL